MLGEALDAESDVDSRAGQDDSGEETDNWFIDERHARAVAGRRKFGYLRPPQEEELEVKKEAAKAAGLEMTSFDPADEDGDGSASDGEAAGRRPGAGAVQ